MRDDLDLMQRSETDGVEEAGRCWIDIVMGHVRFERGM
jgi:hypothetical protein